MTLATHFLLFSFLALSCQSDENEPCKLSDCGPHSCRTKRSGDLCYYVMYQSSSFEDAQNACREVGMTLATPKNGSIPDNIIRDLLSVHGAWLNGIAKLLPKWTFISDKQVIMSGSSGTDCGTMFSRYNWRGSQRVDYFFRPRPCYEPNKFLCRKDNCHPLISDCIIHDSSLRLDWFNAREYCIQRNADLFYLGHDEGGDNMASAFGWTYHDVGNIFIGLRRRAWMWAVDTDNGEMFTDMKMTSWKNGEPNRGYKNCIKLQATGTWDDQECTKTGPFPLCTREAIAIEDLASESTTGYMTTPLDIEDDEKTTTQKAVDTTIKETTTMPTTTMPTTTMPTTTMVDSTTGFANTIGTTPEENVRVRHTTEGTTYKPPSDNKDIYDTTTILPDVETTNIPKTSVKQTTFNPTTKKEIFEDEEMESTRIPSSTQNPNEKSLFNENTTPRSEEFNPEAEVKVVTVRGNPVYVITTRGHSSSTTAPSRRELEDEEETPSGSGPLTTLTKLVLYKFMSNSAPLNVPYLFYLISALVILKDLLKL